MHGYMTVDPKDCCPGEGGCSTGKAYYVKDQLYCRKHRPSTKGGGAP